MGAENSTQNTDTPARRQSQDKRRQSQITKEKKEEKKKPVQKCELGLAVIGCGQRSFHLVRYLIASYPNLFKVITFSDDSEAAILKAQEAFGSRPHKADISFPDGEKATESTAAATTTTTPAAETAAPADGAAPAPRAPGDLKSLQKGSRLRLELIEDDESDKQRVSYGPTGIRYEFGQKYGEVLKRADIDWVLIGSTNNLHVQHCLAAFDAKKHVFCEKPFATTMESALELKTAAEKSAGIFITGFVLRHARLYMKIKEWADAGKFGKIISIEQNELLSPDHGGYIMRNWRRHSSVSGPHILEKCCHDIDIMNWIANSVVSRVSAFGGTNIFVPENSDVAKKIQAKGDKDMTPQYVGWPTWEEIDPFESKKDIEDNLTVALEYRNGVRATFHTNSCSAITQRGIIVCGLEGTCVGDINTGILRFKGMERGAKEEVHRFGGDFHGGGDDHIIAELASLMEAAAAPKLAAMKKKIEEEHQQLVSRGLTVDRIKSEDLISPKLEKESFEQQQKEAEAKVAAEAAAKPAEAEGKAAEGKAAEDASKAILQAKASGREGFLSAVTCLAIDEARKKGAVVDVESYWKQFGI